MTFTLMSPENLTSDYRPVEIINCRLALLHVFTQSISTEKAFMYFFRRYGLSAFTCDEYKSLCRYMFHTDKTETVVSWSMDTGTYHSGLCAYSTAGRECTEEIERPYAGWTAQLKDWAEKQHGWLFYDVFEVFSPSKDGNLVFVGDDRQRAELESLLDKHSGGVLNDESFRWLVDYKGERNYRLSEEFQQVCPAPRQLEREQILLLQHTEPLKAARLQHEWFLSMPDTSHLRQTYLSVVALFKDWCRPVAVRDVLFNLAGEESRDNVFPTIPDTLSGEPVPHRADYFVLDRESGG